MSYTFRGRVLDPSRRVMIYEVVPPEPHITVKALKRSASTLTKNLRGFEDVDGIYVPEVIDESERGSTIARHLKVPARQFAAFVRSSYEQDEGHRRKLIVSHPFAYLPREETKKWLTHTYKLGGIKNIILVGPRHHHTDLPGYSVTESAQIISDMNEAQEIDLFTGAICMDSRRTSKIPGLTIDEPERMVAKSKAGVMYFVNQICYDSQSIVDLLRDYKNECEKQGLEPRRVFIGASPVSSRGTLRVIEDLRGHIDDELKAHLFSHDYGIGNRSIDRIEEMFRRIFEHCYGENIGVPIGICVEHVTDSNFRYALELLESLPEIWQDYHPDSEFPVNINHK